MLAGEVVGSTDIGLPLGPAGKAALLPVNIEAFGKDLGVPQEEVRLYLALREAAHQRLFAHVPWLRSHLFGAVEGYARGIKVDTAKLEDVVGQFDPQNPEQLQDALQQGMFQPEDTPEQKAALARLETALALVEGWVDAVVHAAAEAAPAVGRRAARDAAPPPGDGRPGRADVRHADRSGAAPAPAAGRLPAVGLAHGRARASTAGTACGRTRTCCRRPPTWTTRTASCTASSWTSPSWTRCSARRRAAPRGKPDLTKDSGRRRGRLRATTRDDGKGDDGK